jgi:hypothetical protein
MVPKIISGRPRDAIETFIQVGSLASMDAHTQSSSEQPGEIPLGRSLRAEGHV